MTPSATCPHCHGEKVEPSTTDLPEDERKDCRVCHGIGDLLYRKTEREKELERIAA
jgi:DnaJ-class molecular chaperone